MSDAACHYYTAVRSRRTRRLFRRDCRSCQIPRSNLENDDKEYLNKTDNKSNRTTILLCLQTPKQPTNSIIGGTRNRNTQFSKFG